MQIGQQQSLDLAQHRHTVELALLKQRFGIEFLLTSLGLQRIQLPYERHELRRQLIGCTGILG